MCVIEKNILPHKSDHVSFSWILLGINELFSSDSESDSIPLDFFSSLIFCFSKYVLSSSSLSSRTLFQNWRAAKIKFVLSSV